MSALVGAEAPRLNAAVDGQPKMALDVDRFGVIRPFFVSLDGPRQSSAYQEHIRTRLD
jgi:hypothetical protein